MGYCNIGRPCNGILRHLATSQPYGRDGNTHGYGYSWLDVRYGDDVYPCVLFITIYKAIQQLKQPAAGGVKHSYIHCATVLSLLFIIYLGVCHFSRIVSTVASMLL